MQNALAEGKRHLDKEEFAAAIAQFRAVERDQPKYQGVDLLISDALVKQEKAFETAMKGGQASEQAGKLHDARGWYHHAQEIDPGSTAAREKHAAMLSRLNADAITLFNKASYAEKLQETELAIRDFQQILDLMLPGDEIYEKAAKRLEALKKR